MKNVLAFSGITYRNSDLSIKVMQKFLSPNHKKKLISKRISNINFHNKLLKVNNRNERQMKEELERLKESEAEMRLNKNHFQHLVENADDIITVLDSNLIIRYKNAALKKILGYEPEEVKGTEFIKFIHADDAEEVKQKLEGVVASIGNEDTFECRYKLKNGTWRYLESNAKNVVDPKDGPGVYMTSWDITQRIENRKQLEQGKKQLSIAHQLGRLGSWQWDLETNELSWSEELCKIVGVSKESQPKTYEDFLALLHPDDREKTDKFLKEACKTEKEYGFEHRILRSDGEVKTLFGRVLVETDEKGKPLTMIGTGHDITEIKETEQKLQIYSRRLKKLSARQEKIREEERHRVAREIHDDLGQMLIVLKMNVSLAIKRREKEYGERFISRYSDEISEVIRGIDKIVESVQRITTELRPEVLDDLGLKEAIEWQGREFEKRSGIKLEFVHTDDSFNRLNFEQSTMVFRIFQSMLNNIHMHAEASKVDVFLGKDDEYLVLDVRDNGIGITKEDIEQSDSLGILRMRERSEDLGGHIEFKGETGRGTTVTLKIPAEGNQQLFGHNTMEN